MTYEIKPFDCLCGAQPTIHFRVDGFHVYCTTPQPDCWRRPSALSSDRDTAIWLWNEEIHKSVRAQHLGAAVTPIVRDQLGLNELATHDEVRAAIADLQTTVASQKLDIRHEKSIASAARSDAQQWRGAYDTAQQQAQKHSLKTEETNPVFASGQRTG